MNKKIGVGGGVLFAAALLFVSCSSKNTAFDQTTAHLQSGGDYYSYLAGNEVVKELDSIPPIIDALKEGKSSVSRSIVSVLSKLYPILNDSGLRNLQGYGKSSLKKSDGLFSNRIVFYAENARTKGYIWNYAGKQNHEFEILKKIPESTIVFTTVDFDFYAFYSYLKTSFEKQKDTETLRVIQMAEKAALKAGFDIPKLLKSLDNELVVIISKSEKPSALLPFDIAYMLKTKDNSLFDQLSAVLQKQGLKPKNGTFTFPAPVALSISGNDGYLTVTVGNIPLAETASGKKPNILSSPEFQRYAKGIDLKGISCSYISKEYFNVIGSLMKKTGKLTTLKMDDFAAATFLVTTVNPNGYVTYSNSDQSLVPNYLAMVPVLIRIVQEAGLEQKLQKCVPPVVRVPVKRSITSEDIQRVNALKQIGVGLHMYSHDYNGMLPQESCAAGLEELRLKNYLSEPTVYSGGKKVTSTSKEPLQEKNVAFVYLGGMSPIEKISRPAYTPIAFEKPVGQNKLSVLFMDGHVERITGTSFKNSEDLIHAVAKKYPTLDAQTKTKLLEKAKKADEFLKTVRP